MNEVWIEVKANQHPFNPEWVYAQTGNGRHVCLKPISLSGDVTVTIEKSASRRIVNTYIVELDGNHWTGNVIVKLHEMANGEWYLEDWKGRLVTFSTERALKLINAPA